MDASPALLDAQLRQRARAARRGKKQNKAPAGERATPIRYVDHLPGGFW